MAKEIIMDIDPLGNVKMEGQGFAGRECDAAMQDYEKALAGGETFTRENKPEYNRGGTPQKTVQQRW